MYILSYFLFIMNSKSNSIFILSNSMHNQNSLKYIIYYIIN